jgi:1-acyl-sn-glycerol-3-phosphate acyltransferase
MATYEQELKKQEPVIRFLSGLSLAGKSIEVRGAENWVLEGPNIIIGNHIGSYKDVASLFRVVPRPIFFTANRELFNKEDFYFLIRRYLKRHLRDFGWTVDRMIAPLKYLFVKYVSENIAKIGTVPANLRLDQKRETGETVDKCIDIVRSGRALIALQGRGRLKKKTPNPYVDTFRRGVAFIAHGLYAEHGLNVPVTPIAFYGTHVPVLVPGRVTINVGSPMYIADYLVQGTNEVLESVEKFRSALEQRVKELFFEILRSRD